MAYKTVDLLPYNGDILLTSIKDRIRTTQLIRFIYDGMSKAISAFLSKQYQYFDAQVSENLCQIRACEILDFIDSGYKTNELYCIKNEVAKLVSAADFLVKEYSNLMQRRPSHYIKNVDQDITLFAFLETHELVLNFTEIVYFLVQTHILSEYKSVSQYDISPGIDYTKLCSNLDISSKTFARKIIHHFQRNISKNSCHFIFKLANFINVPKSQARLLRLLYNQDEVGRHVLPCYEATKVLLEYLYLQKKHIQIVVTQVFEEKEEKFAFLLKPTSVYGEFMLDLDENLISQSGVVMFLGICDCKQQCLSRQDYIAKFMQAGFKRVILANMAQHPQFSGIALKDKKHDPYATIEPMDLELEPHQLKNSQQVFLEHKNLAHNIGCSQENSTLFLLTHVRYDIPIRFASSISKTTQLKLPEVII